MNRDCLYSYPKDMCGNYLVGQGIASGDLCISDSLSCTHFTSSTAKVGYFIESTIVLRKISIVPQSPVEQFVGFLKKINENNSEIADWSI